MAKLIGIDVGGTNLRIGVFENMNLVQQTRVQADFSSICKSNPPNLAWETILNITANGIQHILNQYPDIEHIGIGFPGFIDPNTHIILQSPNLPGLLNLNLADALNQRLNKKVIVENDANAAAYGEYCLSGIMSGGLLYVGLGTGVGGGLILNGKPYSGQHGCAMEIGHMIVVPNGRPCGCGNHGCMEQYASASGVIKSYSDATNEQKTAAQIADFADTGDVNAIQAYTLAATSLAQVLASILKVVDLSHIVIGGGMAGAWHLMEDAFNAQLQSDLIPVLRNKIAVKSSQANDMAGMLGAALLALKDERV